MNPQRPIRTIIPEINSTRIPPFRGLSYFTNWNASRHNAGRSEEPVCNDIFKKAGRKKVFEVEKVERRKSNLIHLTYSNLNKYGSNQVDLNHDSSNQVAMHQADSDNVRFDPANSTNTKQISESNFFLCDLLSWGSITSATRK